MAMPLVLPRYTVDDLDSFPDDGNRYELLDGVLLVTPAPLPPHEVVVERLRDHLVRAVAGRAHVFTRGAVRLPPRNHLEPDLLVIPLADRIPRRWSEVRDYWLAVEVSGRGSRVYDRDLKHAAYRALGAREVWRADLGDRSVAVTRPGHAEIEILRERLDWRPPVAGLATSIDLHEVFAGIDADVGSIGAPRSCGRRVMRPPPRPASSAVRCASESVTFPPGIGRQGNRSRHLPNPLPMAAPSPKPTAAPSAVPAAPPTKGLSWFSPEARAPRKPVLTPSATAPTIPPVRHAVPRCQRRVTSASGIIGPAPSRTEVESRQPTGPSASSPVPVRTRKSVPAVEVERIAWIRGGEGVCWPDAAETQHARSPLRTKAKRLTAAPSSQP